MKVVSINTFSYKATGNIMFNIHSILIDNGMDSYVVWGRGREKKNNREIVILDSLGVKMHGIYTRFTDRTGFASYRATRKLLEKLDEVNPEIIHLHNIHGYYINIEMLFNYIKKHNIKVVWTLHDCWAFTGHCAWFDMCGCNKWMAGCNCCEQLKTYPASYGLDASKSNWRKKKELFSDLTAYIVTPSKWLAELCKKSILSQYPVKVIYNGIDLNKYSPITNNEYLKKNCSIYKLDSRPIILGVASEWTERKGLKDFIEISKRLSEKAQIVIVGLTEKQIKLLPNTITGIKRTNNINELVALYSLANVFFNPTYEDNFPTTNLEALACGTPVVTYDTGGSPEAIEYANAHGISGIGHIIKKSSSKQVDLDVVECCLMCYLHSKKDLNQVQVCREAAQFFETKRRLQEYLLVYSEIEKM